jgi:hypothetical protein
MKFEYSFPLRNTAAKAASGLSFKRKANVSGRRLPMLVVALVFGLTEIRHARAGENDAKPMPYTSKNVGDLLPAVAPRQRYRCAASSVG